MKLIESSVEYLPQEEGLEGVYKQIERCARTCYKSEDKITEDSAKGFVDRMIKSHHTAMLEHGTVCLILSKKMSYVPYEDNIYSKVGLHKNGNYVVVTNLRVLQENNWIDDLKYLCSTTKYHEKRYTFKFVCSRAIANELVRHRKFSFAQESQRYCNYSKDKYGNGITFIIPSWLGLSKEDANSFMPMIIAGAEPNEEGIRQYPFFESLITSEKNYLTMLNKGYTPQQARDVLPNATKTELVMTGFASDYRHLLDLRLFGKTGQPHPDMIGLMEKLRYEALEAGIWEDIMKYPSKF